jgi:dipeptidase
LNDKTDHDNMIALGHTNAVSESIYRLEKLLMSRILNRFVFSTAALLVSLFAGDSLACTSIMVGRSASADGSVMTSHTCDSHRNGSDIAVVPKARHPRGSQRQLTKWCNDDHGPMPRYGHTPTGRIAEAPETLGYLAGAYAIMNERQLAIGESTFGGRPELQSARGLIDCEMLTRLMVERASTARQAIHIAGDLLKEHGWCDEGEALTIADPKEVWLLEIVGPGKEGIGAEWAAERIPDDQVSVVANAARIGEIDSTRPDYFLASENVKQFAEEHGYWDKKSGRPFRFYEVYHPQGRTEIAATRREWRVLSLLAPSLGLDPNSNFYPLSVKPDKPVTPARIMEIFRDTYEGTPFDVVKDLTVVDDKGQTVKSPLANPFMPYDMNKMLRINGGWGWMGERQLARWYCMYATVTQSRSFLPDAVGGVVWFGYGNPAMTVYVPLYAGLEDLPESYRTDGRTTGFSRRSAWWAFNRVARLAAHRWGDMRRDVAAARDPMQEKYFVGQRMIEATFRTLLAQSPDKARAFLTAESRKACLEAVDVYWNLGDSLWNKYDEQW